MTKHSPYKREKIYLKGNIFPDIRVGMQRVILTPTVETIDNKNDTAIIRLNNFFIFFSSIYLDDIFNEKVSTF